MGLKSLLTAILAGLAAHTVSAVTLTIDPTAKGNATSPYLWGVMFEDINNSGDGVLHGQMIRNNGFQGTNPGIAPWTAVGGSSIAQDKNNPLTSAITSTLQITTNKGATGLVGASNAGYDLGLRVIADTYATYGWIKGTYSGNVTVAIVTSSGKQLGAIQIPVQSTNSKFTYFEARFNAAAAPDGRSTYQFLFDAAKATSGSLNLGLPRLYPQTFHTRYNGLNNEVASTLNSIGASFLRFPGGNNLEGNTPDDRWKWNLTIGNVEDRPGRQGDWGYANTDELGLVEYMLWTQDMGLEPLLAIWSGFSLDGTAITGNALQPYVQDVLNELEFLMGDKSTKYGALRSSIGFPNPFQIRFIEIGNEDFFDDSNSYQQRFTAFYNAIHSKYPSITIVASTPPAAIGGADSLSTVPSGVWQDYHQYSPPKDYVSDFNKFDHLDRSQPIIVGEFGSTTNDDGSPTYFSNVRSAVSEAVFMLGIERNADLVKMASYAPLLEHFDLAEWSPDLIGFDSSSGVTRSVSFFVQQMFASNRPDTVVPVKSDSNYGPVYWVAGTKGAGKQTFVKIANYGANVQSMTVNVQGKSTATMTALSGQPTQSNLPGNEAVKSTTSTLKGNSGTFAFSLPAWSFVVLNIN